jgi:hypothetical protein
MSDRKFSDRAKALAVYAHEHIQIKTHYWHWREFGHQVDIFDDADIDATAKELIDGGVIDSDAANQRRSRFTEEGLKLAVKWRNEGERRRSRRTERNAIGLVVLGGVIGAVLTLLTTWIVWRLGWNK